MFSTILSTPDELAMDEWEVSPCSPAAAPALPRPLLRLGKELWWECFDWAVRFLAPAWDRFCVYLPWLLPLEHML